MLFSSLPFSMRSSPKRESNNELFSQLGQSPQVNEVVYEDAKGPINLKVNKSRAATHHGTRFNSYNKKLEVREQSLKQGFSKANVTKRHRLMTGKPNRPKSK